MQKRTLLATFAAALFCTAASAAPLFSLDPVAGQITALPNTVVGWGFFVTADPLNWISFTGSALQAESPSVGAYADLIGLAGGPVNAVLPAGASPWIQSFDAGLGYGVGIFSVAPDAAPGSFETGTIVVFYDEFSADPNLCVDCYLGSGSFNALYRVDVGAPLGATATPEPGTAALLSIVILVAAGSGLLRQRVARSRGPG